jgi:hypothetical protein
MLIYYPPLITSAIFFAAIAVNLRNKDYALVFGLALLAIPSILFLTFLSQKGYTILAYILLLVPIILVIAGYEMGKAPTPAPAPEPTPAPAPAPVDRIEPREGVKEDCSKCNLNPCMCPYKPPM